MTASHVALDLALGTTGIAWPGGSDCLVCPNFAGTKRLRWWASSINRFLIGQVEENRIDTVVVGAPFIIPNRLNGAISTLKLYGVGEFIAGNLGLRWVEVTDKQARADVLGADRGKGDVLPWAQSCGVELDPKDPGAKDEADAVLFWTWWADRDHVRGASAPVVSDSITRSAG